MDLLTRPWRRYADFRGRSRRLEYLLFSVTFYGGLIGLMMIGGLVNIALGGARGGSFQLVVMLPVILFILGSIVPGLALTVRRMHDLGMSGWWLMIAFVPVIGQLLAWLLTFIIIFIPAPRGENQYGYDPRDPEGEDDTGRLGEVFS